MNKVFYIYKIMGYKDSVPFSERKRKAELILNQYPDRIPVLVEFDKNLSKINPTAKNKFIVPYDLTIGQFMYVIRKHIKISPEKAIFLFVNNRLLSVSSIMQNIYMDNSSDDGFLYIKVNEESTFG